MGAWHINGAKTASTAALAVIVAAAFITTTLVAFTTVPTFGAVAALTRGVGNRCS